MSGPEAIRSPNSPDSRSPGRAGWILIALALEASCLAYTWISRDFVYGEGHALRPIVAVVAGLLLASALHVYASWRALDRRAPPFSLVLGAAIVFRVTLLFAQPVQEDDHYRYLWDGEVVAAGLDPYRFSPDDLLRAEVDPEFLPALESGVREDLEALVSLRHRSAAHRKIVDRINHPHLATIYPPVAQACLGVVGWLTPEDASLQTHVLALKAWVSLFDLGIVIALAVLLRSLGRPPGLALIYAWSPLVLKEFPATGHLDAFAVFFLVLAFLGARRGGLLVPALSLGAAISCKLFAIVVVPLWLLTAWTSPRWREAATLDRGLRLVGLLAGALGVVVAGELVFLGSLARRQETLTHFLGTWEMHDGIFHVLRLSVEKAAGLDVTAARRVTRLLVAGLLGLVVLVALARLWRPVREGEAGVGSRIQEWVFRVLAWLFLLSPVGFPWYFTWSLPWLVFARNRAWLLLPGLLPIYYLRFALEYGATDATTLAAREALFDDWIVPAEFGLFLVVLLVGWIRARIRARDRAPSPPALP